MRERAFAVLGDRIVDARVLDIYAGTGAVGLEALSRGARSVVFVERHRAAARLIERNCTAFDLDAGRAELIFQPAGGAVLQLSRRGDRFDLAWADPPFEIWKDGLDAVVKVFELGLLANEALACLECPAKVDVASALPDTLAMVRDLAGGASRVVMIERAHR